ncbi:hypothetical protein [Bacteroides sp. BFG-606]|uniref:hypothetical protein n=1 Tax=Bacteroides sp. BFG-606 TaxID=2972763 RepID=UPI00216605AB|nr:hypothetical protein [Bacteroides sp. BFG-606]MCS2333627.1 hypothetical protein [Bacteroides sp. BFG-606]
MKTTIMLFISFLFATSFISCEQTTEDRIKHEFKIYVKENFGEPRDLKEVTSIKLTDTISYKELDLILGNAQNVLNGIKILQDKFININKKKLAHTYQKASREERSDMNKKLHDLMDISDTYESEYLAMAVEIDSMKIDKDRIISFHYEIKARIKKGDEKKVEIYHAYMNNNGDIKIRDYELKMDEMPKEYQEIFKKLEDFLPIAEKMQKSYIDFFNTVKKYE